MVYIAVIVAVAVFCSAGVMFMLNGHPGLGFIIIIILAGCVSIKTKS